MNTIDLSKDFLDLSGNAIPGNNMAKFLAERLAYSQGQAQFAKMAMWAQSLYKDGKLEIDDIDKEFIVAFIKEDKNAISLVKSQLLEQFK